MGRKDLGGDNMIHGKAGSAGCLAVSDETADELFVLAAQIGLSNVKLIIAPTDFRRNGLPTIDPSQPGWLAAETLHRGCKRHVGIQGAAQHRSVVLLRELRCGQQR
jgi:hypothetical protein